MPSSDIVLVLQWWAALFLVGAAAFPLTKRLFRNWFDRGYFFSKAVGMATASYLIYLLGTLHILPFTNLTIVVALGGVFALGMMGVMIRKCHSRESRNLKIPHQVRDDKNRWHFVILVFVEEIFFFGALLFWSWVKAHEPAIRGLEKFMDYGFMQSILNSSWFPSSDMWWAGGFINYYYFGHLVTAVLTKLSGLDLSVTFNLMLATICALTATMSFSIGCQLSVFSSRFSDIGRSVFGLSDVNSGKLKTDKHEADNRKPKTDNRIISIFAGLLTSFLVTFAGNMQTIYAFTKGYVGENVVPFWTIFWRPVEFFSKVGEGMARYWYANATRFIPFTIHEFPSYSFVVSDVHGHVLSIPFVLLAIALLIIIFGQINARDPLAKTVGRTNTTFLQRSLAHYGRIIFYGFILGILLMTNALDGPVYALLLVFVLAAANLKSQTRLTAGQVSNLKNWRETGVILAITAIIMVLTVLPFLMHFQSFATGIGVNCPSAFLANTKIGPFIFEGVEKCQKSPLWMMWLLWGFFWYCGAFLFIRRVWEKGERSPIHKLLSVLFLYGVILIIIPEFFYVKDIYPAHFRSNTMFKLGYQAFILWSIVSAYVIVHFIFQRDNPISNIKNKILNIPALPAGRYIKYQKVRILFFLFLLPQLFLVSIFPIFSVRSYFGELKTYRGIYGLEWLEKEYPDDYAAISWLKYQSASWQINLNDQKSQLPVIVEADGDSYTDYNHVSAFTGVPTIVGWAVHEWLWRGSYDVVVPRREEVRTIYESEDIEAVRAILAQYRVRYVLVGRLEREKFKNLKEGKFWAFGPPVFRSGATVVWEVKEEALSRGY